MATGPFLKQYAHHGYTNMNMDNTTVSMGSDELVKTFLIDDALLSCTCSVIYPSLLLLPSSIHFVSHSRNDEENGEWDNSRGLVTYLHVCDGHSFTSKG